MHSEVVDYLNKSVSNSSAVHNQPELGDHSVSVSSDSILEVCKSLKESSEFNFNVLQVITGCDYVSTEEKPVEDRIEISYILANFIANTELILKTKIPRGDLTNLPQINSVASVWKAANWQERECMDMFGVQFLNHPDHRRILCPDDWEGYPLRKDYKSAEYYNEMRIYPPEKMNLEEHEIIKKTAEGEKLKREKEKAAKAAAAEKENKE
jgi:NADH-quinone oxidoreductase subunit C